MAAWHPPIHQMMAAHPPPTLPPPCTCSRLAATPAVVPTPACASHSGWPHAFACLMCAYPFTHPPSHCAKPDLHQKGFKGVADGGAPTHIPSLLPTHESCMHVLARSHLCASSRGTGHLPLCLKCLHLTPFVATARTCLAQRLAFMHVLHTCCPPTHPPPSPGQHCAQVRVPA
jgi:hypothetical protein